MLVVNGVSFTSPVAAFGAASWDTLGNKLSLLLASERSIGHLEQSVLGLNQVDPVQLLLRDGAPQQRSIGLIGFDHLSDEATFKCAAVKNSCDSGEPS